MLFRQVVQRAFKHFISTGADAFICRSDGDGWLKTETLERPAIGVTNVLTGECDGNAARYDEVGRAAISASGRGADELGFVRGFQEETGVFGLAERALVNEHDGFALVLPLIRVRNSLDLEVAGGGGFGSVFGEIGLHGYRTGDDGGLYILLFGQASCDGSSSFVGIAAHIEDDGLGIAEFVEHSVHV